MASKVKNTFEIETVQLTVEEFKNFAHTVRVFETKFAEQCAVKVSTVLFYYIFY